MQNNKIDDLKKQITILCNAAKFNEFDERELNNLRKENRRFYNRLNLLMQENVVLEESGNEKNKTYQQIIYNQKLRQELQSVLGKLKRKQNNKQDQSLLIINTLLQLALILHNLVQKNQ